MGFRHAFGQAVAVHGEAVIHRDDLDLAGGQVLHRMVGAVMALGHLFGFRAQRQAQHLMTQADAEHRHAGFDHALDGGNGIFPCRRRIAGAVGQQHAMRLVPQHILGGGGGGHHGDVRAHPGQEAQDVPLDAIIDHGDAEAGLVLGRIAGAPGPGHFVPLVGLGGGNLLGQVQPFQSGEAARLCQQRVLVDRAGRPGIDHDAVRHSLFADQRRQGTGIQPGHGRDVVLLQPGIQRLQVAVVGGIFRIRPHDQTAHGRGQGLDILGIGAHDADMGKGEGHDLPGIGGIGQDFLITGHGGVEADLAQARAQRAEAGAFEGAIRQQQAATRKRARRGSSVRRRSVGHGKPRICAKIRR